MIVESILLDGITSDYCFVAEVFEARQQAFVQVLLDYSIPLPVFFELFHVLEQVQTASCIIT